MKWSKYVKPYWKYFILGPLCMIVEVLGEIVMPKLYSQILNVGVETHNVGYIVVTCLLMILTAVLMMGGGVGGAYFGAKAAVNFASDLRRDVYGKVQEFSFANIDKYSTGSLVTRLTNDITQLQNFVNMMLRMFLRAPGMLIGALIMAIAMNPQLARVLAVTIPVILVVEVVVIRTGFPRFTVMQEKIDKLNSRIQESLTNIRVVKSFVREEREDQKFRQANGDLKDAALRALNVVIFMMPLMMLLMNLTTLAVVWFGGKQVIGAFFGYTICGEESGHHAADLVISSDKLDFLASPFTYTDNRGQGVDWAFQGSVESAALYGKPWFMEADVRTCLSRPIPRTC